MSHRRTAKITDEGQTVRIEVEAEWPAGYVLSVRSENPGERYQVISEDVYDDHRAAGVAFAEAVCQWVGKLGELAERTLQTGAVMRITGPDDA